MSVVVGQDEGKAREKGGRDRQQRLVEVLRDGVAGTWCFVRGRGNHAHHPEKRRRYQRQNPRIKKPWFHPHARDQPRVLSVPCVSSGPKPVVSFSPN